MHETGFRFLCVFLGSTVNGELVPELPCGKVAETVPKRVRDTGFEIEGRFDAYRQPADPQAAHCAGEA